MEFEGSVIERLLDLAVFVGLAVMAGVVAIALIERLMGAEQRIITIRRLLIAVGGFLVILAGEALFHLLH